MRRRLCLAVGLLSLDSGSPWLFVIEIIGAEPEPGSQLALGGIGLAHASVLQGDSTQARKSYEDFFAVKKKPDADLPVLIGAKKEYDTLK